MCLFRALLVASVVALSGCAAAAPACTPIVYAISPATATADHTATPPGNQVQFTRSSSGGGGNCIMSLAIPASTFTSSDPVNAPVTTDGLATCKGTTTVPVTIITFGASATLTCK